MDMERGAVWRHHCWFRLTLLAAILVPSLVILLSGGSAARAADEPPRFRFGFAALAMKLGDSVGLPIEDERATPEGDSVQTTTRGLLVWTRADNTCRFTDGYRTWVDGPWGVDVRLNTERFPWEGVTFPSRVPLAPDPIVRGDPATGKVAFTFDMGAHSEGLGDVLAALAAAKVRATFFVTGAWSEQNPDLFRSIVASGHEIANHSYGHPNFTEIDRAAMVRELDRTEDFTRRYGGVSTRPYWRPPYGAYDATVLEVVAEQGYRTVMWTLDSGDWLDETTAERVEARVGRADAGDIVVMHGGVGKTGQAVPGAIRRLRERGLEPSYLSDVLNIRATPRP